MKSPHPPRGRRIRGEIDFEKQENSRAVTSICLPKDCFLTVAILLVAMLPLQAQTTEELQREFAELRFGAFIHFSIMTFTGAQWATPNQDVSKFNPTNLDCGLWADAAVAAKMKFGILTTKHHDGFCLWNSAYTDNDVASSPWKNGQGDVVAEFVDAFRAHGLEPCLYYSVWDNTHGVGNGPITAQDMEFIKGQITELLSYYGNIRMLFIDGWSWKMGHRSVPYDEIRTLVKELQPGCLLVDNTHLRCLYDNDMIHYEAGSAYPNSNTFPAIFSLLINKNSGNDWFWDARVPNASLLSVSEIVNSNLNRLEPQWCSFILNCPPNRDGRLDSNMVNRLKEVGQAWSPNMSRPPLPPQAPQIEKPVTPASATTTSGNAYYAIDGLNDRFYYSVWQSSTSLPQSITIDLGREYSDISILSYVPKYQSYIDPRTEGSITSYIISTSTDNASFTEVAGGEWNGDVQMKVVTFPPTAARYLRLEALTANDGYAAATEIAIGRESMPTSVKNSHWRPSPNKFVLEQNYPNPFNPQTTISYSLAQAGTVTLKVYDLMGRETATLAHNVEETAGSHEVSFDAAELPSGVYFCRLQTERFVETKRMMLIK